MCKVKKIMPSHEYFVVVVSAAAIGVVIVFGNREREH